MFVCMSAQISAIIRATAIKVADNISYYSTQIKLILEFDHTPSRYRKSKTIELQAKFQV